MSSSLENTTSGPENLASENDVGENFSSGSIVLHKPSEDPKSQQHQSDLSVAPSLDEKSAVKDDLRREAAARLCLDLSVPPGMRISLCNFYQNI